jgi:hypothetical protein
MMRGLALLIATLICLQGIAQQTAAADKVSPAARYHAQITKLASHAIESELLKHPEHLKGVSIKLRYIIDPGGHVYNVTVVSIQSDPWVEKTAVKALRATKFPPIPRDVLQEVRMDYLEAEADISYPIETSGNAASPAFDKYNMRVHKMLQDQVRPAFTTQSRRLEVDYEFYLDSQGRVTNLHAYAKAGGSWAERAIADSVRAVKFPAVPPQVFKELEQKPPLKIFGTLSWDPKG